MARDVIISCAVTGSADTVGKHPGVPVTPGQIAQAAIDACKAGAAIVGGFYLEVATSAERDATEAFVTWVRSEARLADEQATPFLDGTTRRSRAEGSSRRHSGESTPRC